ncbi:MAG: hypothetical protein WC683_17970 [bacterium]
MATLLRLTRCGSGSYARIEGDFRDNGALFLESNFHEKEEGGPRLRIVSEPKQGSLLYAAFVRRGRKLVVIPMRADASAILARPPFVNDGDGICLGKTAFTVNILKSSKKAIGVAAISAALLLTSLIFMASADNRGTKSLKAVLDPQRSASVEAEPSDEAETLLDEARAEIRQGNLEQARLALMDLAERGRGGAEARLILNEIERAKAPVSGAEEDERTRMIIEKAKELYAEGLGSMKAGDVAAAGMLFAEASKMLDESNASTSFAQDLARAAAEASDEIEKKSSRSIAGAKALIDSSEEMDAPEAALVLRNVCTEMEGALLADPGNKQLLATRNLARRKLDAALGRWIAGAREMERVSGCVRAVKMYDEIRVFLEDNGLSLRVQGCN